MAQEVSAATISSVSVMCFGFHNPSSINGPFGTFQLWVDGNVVLGRMTMTLLFGLPTTIVLNLEGTSSGTGPIVCTLKAKGYSSQIGQSPSYAEFGIAMSFSSGWSTGDLVLSEVIGITADIPMAGLPVQREECKSS